MSRQKLSLKGDKKALPDDATLASVGITDGGELVVKDLGPQISWRTVFMVEYVRVSFSEYKRDFAQIRLQVGPLIVHPLIYHFPQLFYGSPVQHSLLQKCAHFLWIYRHKADGPRGSSMLKCYYIS